MKKVISILVPTYNEEENVEPLSEAIIEEMGKNLPQVRILLHRARKKLQRQRREQR